ncbi:hypothetical protein KSS87_014110 [Heliosperma pusillum]|nr:hypothetical protein KSS87_014110 [Heliosperma pusillum]
MVSSSSTRSNQLRPKRHQFKRSALSSTLSMTTELTNTAIINPHNTDQPLTAPNLNNVIKLTPLNYVSWRFQLTNILFGLSLFGFLDGSTPTPSSTTINEANQEVPNPAYMSWLKQDGLILGALMGTLTAALQTLIIRAKTSKEAWEILAHTYANPSRVHIQQLKDRLDSIVKTSEQSISDYIHSIKSCVDQLVLMGNTPPSSVLTNTNPPRQSKHPVQHVYSRRTPSTAAPQNDAQPITNTDPDSTPSVDIPTATSTNPSATNTNVATTPKPRSKPIPPPRTVRAFYLYKCFAETMTIVCCGCLLYLEPIYNDYRRLPMKRHDRSTAASKSNMMIQPGGRRARKKSHSRSWSRSKDRKEHGGDHQKLHARVPSPKRLEDDDSGACAN